MQDIIIVFPANTWAYTLGGLYMEIVSNDKTDGLILGELLLGGGGRGVYGITTVSLNDT